MKSKKIVIEEFNSAIEDELIKSSPKILYKYRDWGNEFHKDLLLNNKLWLAHPKYLNDPYDIRLPLVFNKLEIESDVFKEKLRKSMASLFPGLSLNESYLNAICNQRMMELKENGCDEFDKTNQKLREGNFYDCFGVFSLSKNSLDEMMWAHYGNLNKGICIGFDLVKLYKGLYLSFGPVEYGSSPLRYSFLENGEEFMFDYSFYKNSKWAYEEECRFVTPEIQSDEDRLISYNIEAVSEVILGFDISETHKSEIIKVLQEKYYSEVALYQIKQKHNSYGYEKAVIQY